MVPRQGSRSWNASRLMLQPVPQFEEDFFKIKGPGLDEVLDLAQEATFYRVSAKEKPRLILSLTRLPLELDWCIGWFASTDHYQKKANHPQFQPVYILPLMCFRSKHAYLIHGLHGKTFYLYPSVPSVLFSSVIVACDYPIVLFFNILIELSKKMCG